MCNKNKITARKEETHGGNGNHTHGDYEMAE